MSRYAVGFAFSLAVWIGFLTWLFGVPRERWGPIAVLWVVTWLVGVLSDRYKRWMATPRRKGDERRERAIRILVLASAVVGAIVMIAGVALAGDIPVCSGGDRAARKLTCVNDGDGGYEHGVKWRAIDVDTPEIDHAECARERRLGEMARDRLRELMAGGYTIEWTGERGYYGRALVIVRLADGRDAGRVLVAEGLSQPYPNTGNVWCGH